MPVNLANAIRNEAPEANAALADTIEELIVTFEAIGATIAGTAATRRQAGTKVLECATTARIKLEEYRALAVEPGD